MEDQTLLLQQVEDLEKSSPRHPRLGQWKARLDGLNQILSEITDAEERAASKMPPDRPRRGLVPQDPQFEPLQPQIPAKSLPRRKSSPPGTRKTKHDSKPIQEFDATIIMRADAILQELERRKVPMTIQALAHRLGVKTHALYTCAPICDRLAQHNKQCPVSMQEVMTAQLRELQTLQKTATPAEFAQQCGFSVVTLYRNYPEWKQKLADHNRSVQDELLRDQAEQRLRNLISAQTCEPLRDFANHIGISQEFFTKRYPDIDQRVRQHNRELGLRNSINHASKEDRIAHIYKRWNEITESDRDLTLTQLAEQCSVNLDTIRTLCPELLPQLRQPGGWVKRKTDAILAQAFAEIEKSGEVKTVQEFAAAAGIADSTLSGSYHHWVDRLDKHNNTVREVKLQAAWTRMERSGTIWSLEKFVKEAGICTETLKKYYPDWRDRLKAEMTRRDHAVTQRLDQVLEKARQSRLFTTPAEVAKEVGIGYMVLKRHYTSVYNRILEYIEIAFRPRVEDSWRGIIDSGERPTFTEFTQRCGFLHSSDLQQYFPEVAEQLRALDR